jgi:hypothetical protein
MDKHYELLWIFQTLRQIVTNCVNFPLPRHFKKFVEDPNPLLVSHSFSIIVKVVLDLSVQIFTPFLEFFLELGNLLLGFVINRYLHPRPHLIR